MLGSPPVRSGRPASGLFRTVFAAGGTFEWGRRVRLVYNQRFSRSQRGQRESYSYSVPLIPDSKWQLEVTARCERHWA